MRPRPRSRRVDLGSAALIVRRKEIERKARRESDLIVGEARLEAQKILMATADERRNLQSEIVQIQSMKARLIAEMHAILSAHSRMLESYEDESSQSA